MKLFLSHLVSGLSGSLWETRHYIWKLLFIFFMLDNNAARIQYMHFHQSGTVPDNNTLAP